MIRAVVSVMQELHEFARVRRAHRQACGGVIIHNLQCEMEVKNVEDETRPLEFDIRALDMHASRSRSAVMEAMVLTGELAAKWGADKSVPLIFRCAGLR